MTRLTAQGRLIAADDRRLRGRLLPFGTPGRTNLGRVVVNPGGVAVPADVSTLFAHLDHLDGRDDVAQFVSVTETPEGLMAEWDVPETHGGDKLLAEFHAGERTGISVELEPVKVRDGVATGTLIGCAFPVAPAFDDARLIAELAPDTPADDVEEAARWVETARQLYYSSAGFDAAAWEDLAEEDRARYIDAARAAADALAGDQPTDTPPPAEDTPDALVASAHPTPDAAGAVATPTQEDSMTQPAAAPAALLAGAAPTGATPTRTRLLAADATPADVYRLFASAAGSAETRRRLLAALSDIVPADTLDRDQPQWLGEVWSGNAYQRRIVPLLSTGELTDLKVKGWRWVTKPAMAEYAGSKAPVPSNDIATEAYEAEAQRFAGGHDIDRKYRDFGDAAFFAAYFQAMSESYARLTDAYALRVMKGAALPSTLGTVPSGVPAGWVAVVDAALDIIDVGTPTFALVEKSVYRDMFLTGQDKFLEFLNASIGFEQGTINGGNFRIQPVTSSAAGTASSPTGLDKGEVMVGTSAAVKYRELGGGTPIRVDALDLVNGGVDEAVFGYAHTGVEDARGLRIVDITADA